MPRTKQFNEQAVLEKAVTLFWRQGYHATSMQQLVDFLGINRASLYGTFGGKKELFQKALQYYREKNHTYLHQLMNGLYSPKEVIYNLFSAAIEDASSDTDRKGCFISNSTSELAPHDEEINALIQENQQKFHDVLLHLIYQAQDQGEISPEKDAPALAHYLFTLYTGLKLTAKSDPTPERLKLVVKMGLKPLE